MDIYNFKFDFVRMGPVVMAISAIAMAVAILVVVFKGMNFGVDFTGGTLVEVRYAQPVEIEPVREALAASGVDAQVQHFGTAQDVMIRLAPVEGANQAQVSADILTTLRQGGQEVSLQRVEYVGPQVGDELVMQGFYASLWVMLGMLLYIYFRFEWRFAVNLVFTLVHDVVVTVGIFALLGLQFDLTALAGVLAMAGYSVNDTIVIFDRIRENFLRMRKATSTEVVNASVNQTLSRTFVTGGTVLFVLAALYFLGGDSLKGFSFVLGVGILVGTYSSIFIASVVAVKMGVTKADLLPPEKEGAEFDSLP